MLLGGHITFLLKLCASTSARTAAAAAAAVATVKTATTTTTSTATAAASASASATATAAATLPPLLLRRPGGLKLLLLAMSAKVAEAYSCCSVNLVYPAQQKCRHRTYPLQTDGFVGSECDQDQTQEIGLELLYITSTDSAGKVKFGVLGCASVVQM